MAGQVRLRDQFAALERAMRDWELVDSDRFSFEDSDRFEEDSLCSWISEPESLCNNWRGWKKSTFSTLETNNPAPTLACVSSGVTNEGNNPLPNPTASNSSSSLKKSSGPENIQDSNNSLSKRSGSGQNLNLVELAARLVASHIPFEMVEKFPSPVPEQLQLRIAFWSFPENEEDIRLYSCLANGSAEEFQKGERLFRSNSVSDILQIGFHLSATVKPNMREAHKVTVTFDRRRVISCTCTCNASTNWCGHVVAVCLHRIIQSKDVVLRAPVSESLSRLHREQLQKFAQYLISELPHQILPTAQRLLDELLSSQDSAINTLRGAPDPTAGASANEQTTWYLDERTLHGNIHKILIKFCVPAPIVFSDVNYLSSAAPPASAEWSSLLRPVRGREPEGMWNLLSIVREMFRREDRNAIPLLEIITEECLNCDQILVWWFNTKVALHNGNAGHGGKHHSVNSNAHACQHAGASLCDEIVFLWRLAALNPGLSPEERCILHKQFKEWHLKIIEKVSKSRNASVGSKQANSFKNDVEVFPGFRPSIEACYLNWDNYPIPGVTYSESNLVYHCPFMCFRHSDRHSRSGETGMIHSSHAILNNPVGEHHLLHSSATISSVPLGSKRPRSVEFGPDGQPGLSLPAQTSGPSTSRKSKNANKLREREVLAASLNLGEPSAPVLPVGASGLKIKARALSLEQTSSFDDETPGPSSAVRSPQSPPNIVPPAVVVPAPRAEARDGDRSSISSEGFCEHEILDDESEILRDEGGLVLLADSNLGARSSAATAALSNSARNSPIITASISPSAAGVGLKSSTPLLLGSSGSGSGARGAVGPSTPGLKQNDSNKSLSNSASDELENEADIDADADSDSSTSARACAVLPPTLPKLDSSDSQQSGDEYQLYYYDTKTPIAPGKRENSKDPGEDSPLGFNVFTNVKKIEDPWDILFARAEGLHAHGHSKEACVLGVKLAGELLANPPDLTLEPPAAPLGKGKKRKNNPASHQISCLASATLAKCGFLCTVLAENPEFYYLAFHVGMFGLELARPPASTKPLEVKLANQEAELAQLLKKICIGQKELEMIREKAEGLRDGKFKSRGDALLPLVFANFIFEALVMPANREGRCSFQADVVHLPSDETLGFEAAVAALGLKANVSEAEHPLLCEGTRRQRGDLALAMLLHYKDQPEKLAKVMDKLLDRDIHQLYKAPLPSSYYSNNPPTTTLLGSSWANRNDGQADSPSLAENGILSAEATTSPNNTAPQPHHSKVSPKTSAEAGQSPTAESANGTSANSTAPAETTGNNAATGATEGAAATSNGSSSGTSNGISKGRFKGKRNYPVLPNQPSEAGAHFMFELAKIVLGKAGGSSNQSLFTQPSARGNPRGPHRALHMCAFHIGLYALGLHNAVSPNWLSRTYSSHQTWIMGQAMEIGAPAIAFLIDTWDNHLTPAEAVTIADRASRGDANMVRAAAELALSCLPHAHALNINEIHRAILQCKEQSDGMLEKACMIVEASAKGGGVYPEVLFDVARQWYSLYQKHLPLDVDLLHEEMNHSESLGSLDVDSMNPHNMSQQGNMNQVGQHIVPASMGGQAVANSVEMLGLPPPGPTLSHQQQQVYPLAAPQVPMASIPFATAPYGQVPFLPAAFNPVPGNFVYGPTVIYQASLANNPSVATTAAGYFSQQPQQQQQQQQTQSGMSYNGAPSMHQQPIHSIVSAGQALQYYPSVSPITSTGPTHLRPNAQFFPVGNMSVHPAHANSRNNIPLQNGSNVSAVMASAGHSFLPPSHQHKLNVTNQGHLVTISTSSGSNGQPITVETNMVNGAPANQHPHPAAVAAAAAQAHNMAIAQAQAQGRASGIPQINRGATIVSHGNNNFAIGGVLTSQAQPMPQHACINSMGNLDGSSNSGQGQPRSAIVFSQGGREFSGQQGSQTSAIKMKYLYAAYRVGMLALETLARRVHDDRPAAKFARNPPYGEDVKWLLGISRKLGTQYLQQFCICAVSSIANPFVLHEIILDAAFISSRNNLAWVYQNPRSPLSPLVQKCQQMYFQCLHQKLYHITLSDYEDFVSIVCTARQAFHLTPDGNSQFKEWLQNLRRSKACKKDLWAQITQALQSNPK